MEHLIRYIVDEKAGYGLSIMCEYIDNLSKHMIDRDNHIYNKIKR